ncbi:MAG: two-component system response regulator [Epsilonproteobacteria bacterium]|nr:MAG: two-component system response regulator [Campylobacterota bacterium]
MARILVVDDAKIMRMNIKKMLTSLGHEVIAEAASGHEAIEQYKKYSEKIDLVTMDITMPMDQGIEDGIMAVKLIVEFDPSAKIIMVTSHGEQAKVIQAIQSGASNYLLKPIQMDKLTDALNKLGI